MANAIIENFSRGLDTRRSELTSALGVLAEISNAFINQGGEIEKRKAFVGTNISPTPASLVSQTFGIEALRDSLVIFGGDVNSDPTNWPPAGYTYQRLYRPTTGASAEKKATGIIYSTTFNNKAFVIAEMEDDTINCFYDGELIKDINYWGLVLPDMDTLMKLYLSMVLAFERYPEYTVELNDDEDGIVITGAEGKSFDVLAEGTGTFESNEFEVLKLSNPLPGVPGTAAIGSFTITDLRNGQPSVQKITSITVGGTELLLAEVQCDTSPETVAAAVAAAINNNTGIGYTAENVGGVVVLTAETPGTAANDRAIVVTTTGRVFIGHTGVRFSGGNFQVTSIKAGATELLSDGPYTVDGSNTLLDAITDMANDIFDGVGTHGFIAIARGDTLNIGKRVVTSIKQRATDSQDDSRIRIVVTIDSTSGGDAVDNSNTIKVIWDTLEGEVFQAPQLAGISQKPIKFHLVGGKPPYTFQYVIEEAGGLDFVILSPDEAVTHIQQTKEMYLYTLVRSGGHYYPSNITPLYPNVTPKVKVIVRDSAGNEGESAPIPIKFTLASKNFVQSLYP